MSPHPIRPLGIAACLAVLVVLGLVAERPASRVQRLSNLDLEQIDFPTSYLVFSRSEADRCWLVDRRDATLRRSDRKQPGRKRHCHRISRVGGAGTWILQSKLTGTVALVPLLELSDWTYPFLYEFVRSLQPHPELPAISWTQLYVSRISEGLYLRVPLPYDERKKDGRVGPLRELLSVRGRELAVVDTRLEASHGHYTSAVAEGRFPSLSAPPPALAWLAHRAPTPGATFLLATDRLVLLPLPVSVAELFRGLRGRPAPGFTDDRYRLWTQPLRQAGDGPPFGEDEWARLRAEFEIYADRLLHALRIQGELEGNRARLEQEIPQRQAALTGLGLGLGPL